MKKINKQGFYRSQLEELVIEMYDALETRKQTKRIRQILQHARDIVISNEYIIYQVVVENGDVFDFKQLIEAQKLLKRLNKTQLKAAINTKKGFYETQ